MERYEKLLDEQLVEKVRSIDQELYVYLVQRYEDKLLRYAIYLVHDEQLGADIVQESFIKAFVNLRGFDKKKKFSSWIYRIVHNESMNSIKKQKKEISFPDDFDITDEHTIEETYEKNEVIKQVEKCLNDLPVLYGEPLSLFFLDDKSYEEISDILRLPMGTVATRINRAKTMMKIVCKRKK